MRDHVLVLVRVLVLLLAGAGRHEPGVGVVCRRLFASCVVCRRYISAGAGTLAAQKGLRETVTIGSVRVHGVCSATSHRRATRTRAGVSATPRYEREGRQALIVRGPQTSLTGTTRVSAWRIGADERVQTG